MTVNTNGNAPNLASVLVRRVIGLYGRVHPSMYDRMTWRISEENCEIIAREMTGKGLAVLVGNTMLGMPIEFVDGNDEILLVVTP